MKRTWLMSSPKKKSTRESRLEKIEQILEAHEKSMANFFIKFRVCTFLNVIIL